MVSWAEAIDRHFGLGSLRQRWPASCFVLLSAATACGAAPAASPGQARVPTLTNPCLSAPMRAFAVDRSQPRDYRRARSVFDRGIALQHEGRHAEALALFNRAVTIDGTFGLAHLEAAVSHLYTDNAQDALRKHLSAAVVLLPRNPRAQLQYARFQWERGDPELAERHFDCALDLDPGLAPAHEAMARLFLAQNRIADAERRARSAVALDPEQTTYRVLLADVLTRRERWMEAGVEVEQAAKQVGRSAALYRRAAELYAQAGASDDATRLRRVADQIDPPPEQRDLRPLRRRRRARR